MSYSGSASYDGGFSSVDPPLLGVDVTEVTVAATDESKAQYKKGTKVVGYDASGHPKTFRYVRIDGATAFDEHQLYALTEDYNVSAKTDTDVLAEGNGAAGVFEADITAPGSSTYQFAWIQTGGHFDAVSLLTGCLEDAGLYITATAGSLDDVAVAAKEYKVVNLRNCSGAAVASSTEEVECFSGQELQLVLDETT